MDLDKALGMPDKEDLEYITMLLKAFEKKFPGELKRIKKEAQLETEVLGRTEFGGIKGTSRRLSMRLPEPIYKELQKSYPSMIGKDRSPKHVAWLLRHFPVLAMSERY